MKAALAMALRSEPGPLSLVLVTVKVAAKAGQPLVKSTTTAGIQNTPVLDLRGFDTRRILLN